MRRGDCSCSRPQAAAQTALAAANATRAEVDAKRAAAQRANDDKAEADREAAAKAGNRRVPAEKAAALAKVAALAT